MRSWKIVRDDKGFTGLEAAIVLIAFVVVAAVFSYVMLGAGFFTTQKSKQVVSTGVAQASSSLEMDGQYIVLHANTTGSSGDVSQIDIYVTQTAGGTAVDLNKTTISLKTETGYKQLFFNSTTSGDYWWWTCVKGDNDNLVEANEKYKISLNLSKSNWSPAAGSGSLPGTDDKITIEIKPSVGAPLIINKQLPPSLDSITYV
jgi:flagellin FlaB